MKTQRLSIRWLGLWMAALSACALACGSSDQTRTDSDGGESASGAGGASDAEGGTPSNPDEGTAGDPQGGSAGVAEGGTSSNPEGGTPSNPEGGSAPLGGSDATAGGPSNPDPEVVDWLAVAGGTFPGGDGSGSPCSDVEAELLHDQDELDQWGAALEVNNLEFIVDWTTKVAIGTVSRCSTSGHVIEGGDLTHDGTGQLDAEFTVTNLDPSFAVPTTVWSVFAVDGRTWTSVSATTTD